MATDFAEMMMMQMISEKEKEKANPCDARLVQILKDMELDAVLVTDPYNVRYLSGFAGEAILLISKTTGTLITDSRYTIAAMDSAGQRGFDVLEMKQDKPSMAWLKEIISEDQLKVIGFENENISYKDFDDYSTKLEGVEWKKMGDALETLRMIKNFEELTHMQIAAGISDIAFNEICKIIQPGMTELDVAAELEYIMKMNGGDGLAFDTIVASGKNSAKPHAVPGKKYIQEGDFVTMDFGCKYNGYCSDMTRTIVVGKASEEQKKVYDVVLKAQLAALDALKPGMKGKEVDKVARDIITEAGYGENFGHGLGHSVGLFIHEEPRLSPSEDRELIPNTIETVEPGIYIADFGGVRIEDMVVLTEDGCRVLSKSPKQLIEILPPKAEEAQKDA